jgi:hypothetical protein
MIAANQAIDIVTLARIAAHAALRGEDACRETISWLRSLDDSAAAGCAAALELAPAIILPPGGLDVRPS